jgi:hypothetical protein
MTVTVLLQASPELLDCLNGLTAAINAAPGVEKIRSIKVRPEDGYPNERVYPEVLPAKKEVPVTDIPPTDKPARKTRKVATQTESVGETETGNITIQALRVLAVQKRDEGKRDSVKALISEFGVNSITEMKPEDYSEFHAKLLTL